MSSDSDSDSDDCGRLSPLFNINPSLVLTNTKQKSVQDLLNESRSMIEDLKIVKSTFVPFIKIESEEIFKDHGQTDSKSEVQNLNELVNNAQVLRDSQKIFGKSDYLQFFSLKDLSLHKYYYYIPDEKLSRPEKILLSCSPESLHTYFSHALQGFSVSSFSDLNPIVHYALGIVCIHEEIAVVDKCTEFINKMLREHFNVASISFSSEEMFCILFNYGVDIKNSPIFKFLPVKNRRIIKKVLTEDTKKIPQYWKHNLRSVLCCLSNVFKYCKFNKIDLSNIFFYLLMMSVDETLRAHFTNLELKICLCNVLLSFSDQVWPFCVTWMKSTLMSQTINLPADQKWGFILLMTQAIPNTLSRGKQLRTQLAFLSVMHLCGTANLQAPSEYPEESCVVSKFLDSLENFPHIPSHLQKFCIDFIDIFLAHYEFLTKDEYTNVCKAVKICEHSVTKGKWEINFESNEMTLALQLVKIYSVLKMMPNKYMGLKEISGDDVDDQIVKNISTAENNTEESYPLLKPPRPGECSQITTETFLSDYCMEEISSVSISEETFDSVSQSKNLTTYENREVNTVTDSTLVDKNVPGFQSPPHLQNEVLKKSTDTLVINKNGVHPQTKDKFLTESMDVNVQLTVQNKMKAKSLPNVFAPKENISLLHSGCAPTQVRTKSSKKGPLNSESQHFVKDILTSTSSEDEYTDTASEDETSNSSAHVESDFPLENALKCNTSPLSNVELDPETPQFSNHVPVSNLISEDADVHLKGSTTDETRLKVECLPVVTTTSNDSLVTKSTSELPSNVVSTSQVLCASKCKTPLQNANTFLNSDPDTDSLYSSQDLTSKDISLHEDNSILNETTQNELLPNAVTLCKVPNLTSGPSINVVTSGQLECSPYYKETSKSIVEPVLNSNQISVSDLSLQDISSHESNSALNEPNCTLLIANTATLCNVQNLTSNSSLNAVPSVQLETASNCNAHSESVVELEPKSLLPSNLPPVSDATLRVNFQPEDSHLDKTSNIKMDSSLKEVPNLKLECASKSITVSSHINVEPISECPPLSIQIPVSCATSEDPSFQLHNSESDETLLNQKMPVVTTTTADAAVLNSTSEPSSKGVPSLHPKYVSGKSPSCISEVPSQNNACSKSDTGSLLKNESSHFCPFKLPVCIAPGKTVIDSSTPAKLGQLKPVLVTDTINSVKTAVAVKDAFQNPSYQHLVKCNSLPLESTPCGEKRNDISISKSSSISKDSSPCFIKANLPGSLKHNQLNPSLLLVTSSNLTGAVSLLTNVKPTSTLQVLPQPSFNSKLVTTVICPKTSNTNSGKNPVFLSKNPANFITKKKLSFLSQNNNPKTSVTSNSLNFLQGSSCINQTNAPVLPSHTATVTLSNQIQGPVNHITGNDSLSVKEDKCVSNVKTIKDPAGFIKAFLTISNEILTELKKQIQLPGSTNTKRSISKDSTVACPSNKSSNEVEKFSSAATQHLKAPLSETENATSDTSSNKEVDHAASATVKPWCPSKTSPFKRVKLSSLKDKSHSTPLQLEDNNGASSRSILRKTSDNIPKSNFLSDSSRKAAISEPLKQVRYFIPRVLTLPNTSNNVMVDFKPLHPAPSVITHSGLSVSNASVKVPSPLSNLVLNMAQPSKLIGNTNSASPILVRLSSPTPIFSVNCGVSKSSQKFSKRIILVPSPNSSQPSSKSKVDGESSRLIQSKNVEKQELHQPGPKKELPKTPPSSESEVDGESSRLTVPKNVEKKELHQPETKELPKTPVRKSSPFQNSFHNPSSSTLHQSKSPVVLPLRSSNFKLKNPYPSPTKRKKHVNNHSLKGSIIPFLMKKESNSQEVKENKQHSKDQCVSSKDMVSNSIKSKTINHPMSSVPSSYSKSPLPLPSALSRNVANHPESLVSLKRSAVKTEPPSPVKAKENQQLKSMRPGASEHCRQNQASSPKQKTSIPVPKELDQVTATEENDFEVLYCNITSPVCKTFNNLGDEDVLIINEKRNSKTVANFDIITID